MRQIVSTQSPEETERLARRIGQSIRTPCLILLQGEMGSGKTAFAKAFAEGFGSPDETNSPTFALANTYQGERGVIHHLDLYRIADEEELYYMGLEDYLQSGDAVLIEWPELARLDQRADLIVGIHSTGPESRVFSFDGSEETLLTLFGRKDGME